MPHPGCREVMLNLFLKGLFSSKVYKHEARDGFTRATLIGPDQQSHFSKKSNYSVSIQCHGRVKEKEMVQQGKLNITLEKCTFWL